MKLPFRTSFSSAFILVSCLLLAGCPPVGCAAVGLKGCAAKGCAASCAATKTLSLKGGAWKLISAKAAATKHGLASISTTSEFRALSTLLTLGKVEYFLDKDALEVRGPDGVIERITLDDDQVRSLKKEGSFLLTFSDGKTIEVEGRFE